MDCETPMPDSEERVTAAGQPAVSPLLRATLPTDTVALARHLLGKILVREFASGRATARIVETEAYVIDDPACHAYRGITPRNRSLFLDVGYAYVYLCYGTSFMLNVASERHGIGAGVLLRALEPLSGVDHLQRSPTLRRPRDLTRGPGRLTSALAIDRRHDGLDLLAPGSLWLGDDGARVKDIGESVRIGLTRGAESRLRFFVPENAHLSGPRRLNARPV